MAFFVAGAGELGLLLAELLVSRGDTVHTLRRSAQVVRSGIQAHGAALDQPERYRQGLEACSAVVFCAAPEAADEAAYRKVYEHGLSCLLQLCGARPLLLCTSTAVYGQDDGSVVDEHSFCQPDRTNGRILLAAEQSLRPHDSALRLSGLYGRASGSHLLARVRTGTPVQAQPPLWSNRIHLADAAGAIAHLLELPARAATYNLSDDQPVPQHEMHAWLAARLGLPAPPSLSGKSAGKRVSNRRLRESGFVFRYPSFREGYAGLD